jgi:8-oxo-dGTP pyrophosphatase MutT (NUDIX family)
MARNKAARTRVPARGSGDDSGIDVNRGLGDAARRSIPERGHPTLPKVTVAVAVRRRGYRVAFALLRAYWFVRRPALRGVKCVLTNGDQVLLVRHTYGSRDWDLPGGAVSRGEPPVATARREMHEELGIAIDHWTPLGDAWTEIHHARGTLHCYHAEIREPEFSFARAELAAAGWFRLGQLPPDLKPWVPGILARLDPTPTRSCRAACS